MKQILITLICVVTGLSAAIQSPVNTKPETHFLRGQQIQKNKDVSILAQHEVVRLQKTWSDARVYCSQLSRRLVVLETQQELSDVVYMMQELGIREAWTGGRGALNGEDYVWATDNGKLIDLPVSPICEDTFPLGVKLNRSLLAVESTTKLPFVCEAIN